MEKDEDGGFFVYMVYEWTGDHEKPIALFGNYEAAKEYTDRMKAEGVQADYGIWYIHPTAQSADGVGGEEEEDKG